MSYQDWITILSPVWTHLGLIAIAFLFSLVRIHFIWDIGIMLLVLIMPFYGFSTEHFWAIWLVHLLVTPLFGYLGAMFAEKVIKQEYGPGSIGHLFTVSVFTGALGASATAKILMWLWSLLVVAFS